MDQLGNSLAAQSESALQTVYAAQDVTIIGSDRTNPVPPQIGFNVPTFETSSDIQIEQAYAKQFASILSGYAENSNLQITFANGTVASLTVSWSSNDHSNPANFHLVWIPGSAKNKNGQPIEHNGTPAPTKLNNGTIPDGGGNSNLPGLGAGNSGWSWQLTNVPSGTVEVGPLIEIQSFFEGGAEAHFDSFY